MPQLLSFTSGNPGQPGFYAVAAGDVTGDGYPDLYFGDTNTAWQKDMNNRLLINDGNGFFTDESLARMKASWLSDNFCGAVEIEDMNLDGVRDIVRASGFSSSRAGFASIVYNNPASEGVFHVFSSVSGVVHLHVDVGDLNNDGRADMILSDRYLDRYRFNLGNNGHRIALFGNFLGGHLYELLSGGQVGISGNCLIADLDGDGWNDSLHADLDDNDPGSWSRLHIYHNLGGAPGATDIVLREERELDTGNLGTGWLGAVGLHVDDLTGTHDVAAFDVDNDADLDLVISRAEGTEVWLNQTSTLLCQTSLGHQGPGFLSLSICGDDLTLPGSRATLEVAGATPSALVLLPVAAVNNPTPWKGGILVPFPWLLLVALPSDPTGGVSATIPGSGRPPATIYVQAIDPNPTPWEFSNALEVVLGL